jgi:hypothetical protein
MKKATVLGFLLAVAIGASAQSVPNAHGKGPVAIPHPTTTNSTVSVPPTANIPPIAVRPPVAVRSGKRK